MKGNVLYNIIRIYGCAVVVAGIYVSDAYELVIWVFTHMFNF